jgi:hypothetical protein
MSGIGGMGRGHAAEGIFRSMAIRIYSLWIGLFILGQTLMIFLNLVADVFRRLSAFTMSRSRFIWGMSVHAIPTRGHLSSAFLIQWNESAAWPHLSNLPAGR